MKGALAVAEEQHADEAEILQTILSALRPLDSEDRKRILVTVATFYQLDASGLRTTPSTSASTQDSTTRIPFSSGESTTPKEFLVEKRPGTDVERVACLAYYLTHYKNQPKFKTLDISKLNTDAAQPKFANTAVAVKNAIRLGYLAPASQGMRQLSAAGEQFVRALPDRAAARNIMASLRPRKTRKRRSSESQEKTSANE